MPDRTAEPVYRLANRGPAARLVFRAATSDGTELIVIAGYQGPALPDALTGPELVTNGAGRWRLTCAEGAFDLAARGVDRISLRPSLFANLHARFALSRADRVAVRALLGLLRFPGGARILRWWQLRR